MALLKWKNADQVSKVQGPIRCHKCQLKCDDAGHYLNHECKPTPSFFLTFHRVPR